MHSSIVKNMEQVERGIKEIHIIFFFQQLLVESISSVVWQIVSISGEKLKA